MKNFLKKIAVFVAIVAAVFATLSITSPTSTSAADVDTFHCAYFAGMPSWDCGVIDVDAGDNEAQDKFISNIAKIASNILTDLTVAASYLIIGYVIYGGYMYISSSGDPGKAATGKKALTQAFIGLAIVLSAYTIFSSIRIALIGDKNFNKCSLNAAKECVDGGQMIVNLIQWVAGIAGVVSAVFIVIGGWGYITASGDPNKLQKAKSSILYALIGLVIVALTEVGTAVVARLIRENNTSFVNTSLVADINNKEIIHEKT